MNKIIVNTLELLDTAGKIGMVAEKKSIIAFNMMKKQQGDKVYYAVTVTAFDGKTQIASNLFAKGAEVDGDQINFTLGYEVVGVINAVSREGSETTVLEINSNSVTVISGSSSVTLALKSEGIAPVVFDLYNRDMIEGYYELNTAEFKDAIERVSVAVDNNPEARCPGICLSPMDNGTLILRSLNGVCMAQSICVTVNEQVKNRTVFSTLSRLLKSVISTVSGDTVKVYKTTSHMVIQSKMQLWQLPLLDNSVSREAFDKILSGVRPVVVNIKKDLLINAVAVVQAAAQDDKCVLVYMNEGKIAVSSPTKSARTIIAPDNMTGELQETALNVQYLKTVLGIVKGNEVVIKYKDATSAMSIAEKGNDKAVAIIAPLRH